MPVREICQHTLARAFGAVGSTSKSCAVAAMALGLTAASLGIAEAAAHVTKFAEWNSVPARAAFTSGPRPGPLTVGNRLVWEGADLDGDGQADIANPTGQAPRGEDAYGEGRYHATRDGGSRDHDGVDYMATPGQTVEAPISGYVSKIGYAYPDDESLKFVEIDNPALQLTARVFYVDATVNVGDAVAVGRPIGLAHSLQRRYRGIIDHVHLEIAERGRKVDAATLITARAETFVAAAD
jgi:murein DD-endopeptidase MepM/ murein hydrolase activator NlpD